MADGRYFVEVWPSDTSRDSNATIHLGDCPDCIKGRRQAREEKNPDGVGWWGPYYSYRRAEQEAATNHYTGLRRDVFNCEICEPEKQ